ncbi:MAG: BLUF domain-containing protein [Candidatus Cyclobacteriaceae bacterium M3_2C_046]
MLSQLIYVSVRKNNCTDQEIENILASSNKNNGKKDITGVLLFSDTKFLQVLEGEKSDILALYDHIKLDERHKNVMMISLKPITQRYFPSWQMGSKAIDTQSFSFLTEMSSQEQTQFKSLLEGKEQQDAIKVIHKLFK